MARTGPSGLVTAVVTVLVIGARYLWGDQAVDRVLTDLSTWIPVAATWLWSLARLIDELRGGDQVTVMERGAVRTRGPVARWFLGR